MIQRCRALVAALLAPLLFLMTLGRVGVDASGEAGAAGGPGDGPETVDASGTGGDDAPSEESLC